MSKQENIPVNPLTRMNYYPFEFGLKESGIAGYARLARIVNPNNDSLRVLYAGSGGDFITSTVGINSDRNVHINQEALNETYWGTQTILDRIKQEFHKLGIIDLEVTGDSGNGTLRFHFIHPNDTSPRGIREIRFYARDYFTFWPPEYKNGYDVLIVRGETPNFDSHDIQMEQLGKKMTTGGFFVGDRPVVRYLYPVWVGFEEVENNIQFPCGHAKVYEKIHQVDESVLLKLFRIEDYIDLLDQYFNPLDMDNTLSQDDVIKKINDLSEMCESLPEGMKEQARLIAGANMRWVRCENSWKGDFSPELDFPKELGCLSLFISSHLTIPTPSEPESQVIGDTKVITEVFYRDRVSHTLCGNR